MTKINTDAVAKAIKAARLEANAFRKAAFGAPRTQRETRAKAELSALVISRRPGLSRALSAAKPGLARIARALNYSAPEEAFEVSDRTLDRCGALCGTTLWSAMVEVHNTLADIIDEARAA